MILLIRMKNATTAPRAWAGQEIQPGEYYELQANEKEQWENDSAVLESITLGELVVNDGEDDLVPEDGIMRLQAETEAQRVLFKKKGFYSKECLSAIQEASTMCTGLIGLSHTATYSKTGELLVDTTLPRAGTESDKYVVPISSRLKAVSFSTGSQSRLPDFDLSIIVRNRGKVSVQEKFRVRGSWYGFFTVLDPATIEAGSVVSVGIELQGYNPTNLCVDLVFQSVSDRITNESRRY